MRFLWRALYERYVSAPCSDARGLRRHQAARIKDLLIELGPTFIKVGQFLSVRRDALPLEIADEFSLLQDRVPPVSKEVVRQTVAADLGAQPEDLFLHFEEEPIASASIGQVHRAILHDGRSAVLKIQRPELIALFYQDLGYMRLVSRTAARLGWSNADGWMALADEFGRTLFTEIDYLAEGRSADRLRTVLRNYPQVRIPRVYWRYTGRRVIALEYIPGIKIDRVEELKALGVNLRTLGNLLVEIYLEQIVSSGFFHADPHAGNLAVDEEGNLIIYDFGMMGTISQVERAALTACISAVCRRDAHMLAAALVDLGVMRSHEFAESVARAVQPLIDYYCGQDILEVNFESLEAELDSLVSKEAFGMPVTLAYLLRTGAELEGIARTLRPNFSFAQAAKPFIRRLAIEQGLESLSRALEQFAARIIVEIPTVV